MRTRIALLLAGTTLVPAAAQSQEISYWMWDNRQAPVYQQCADAFHARHPDITVKITQEGWDNYWTTLTTSLISGEAPDVFVNHVSRFPEFAANGVLTDMTPLIEADGYDMTGFLPGLATTWNRDGAQYGMPKDWDTVAIVYNSQKLEEAGLTPDDLSELTWNPADGGSFQTAIAHLTVDAAGKRGDEPGFDPAGVTTYGLALNPISEFGQTEWSYLAASTGWSHIDGPWANRYHYDDPRLAETFTWLRDLARVNGYMPRAEQQGKLGGETLFVAGQAAMTVHGSWMIGWFADNASFPFGFAPVPAGPEGRRSMFNGLADSIWAGSANQDAAWEWVKFLGSSECQTIVGQSGVVFPARPEGVEAAIAAHKAAGIDTSAFTDLAKPETTFPYPMTDYGNEIAATFKAALQQVMLGDGDPVEILKSANEEANSHF